MRKEIHEMTNPADDQVSQAEKPVEQADLSKDTLEDLDAPEEAAEDAKGGFRSCGCGM